MKETDIINHPDYYKADFPPVEIECIDITRHLPFTVGNAFKYLWRAGRKDSEKTLEDARKALWYLRDALHHEMKSVCPAARAVFKLIPETRTHRWAAMFCIVSDSLVMAERHVELWIEELENDKD